MSAPEAAAAMRGGIHDADPAIECVEVPLSDGGEGFVTTVANPMGAELVGVDVRDALGRPHRATYARKGDLAIVEVAEAVGLAAIPPRERDVMASASWGVGDMIRAALDGGARQIVVGLGGSATSDGGVGMLVTLGLALFDALDQPLTGTPQSLASLSRVDAGGLDPRLRQVQVTIASDVRNPLLGSEGAAATFGPQKGASAEQVPLIDAAVARFCELAGKQDLVAAPGAGAAGGLGFALLGFANAGFRPGIDVAMELAGFDETVRGADWVFTGEGGMDGQTLMGKAPWGVAQRARELGSRVVGFAGRLGTGWERLLDAGFVTVLPISNGANDLETCLANGPADLRRTAASVTRLLKEPATRRNLT